MPLFLTSTDNVFIGVRVYKSGNEQLADTVQETLLWDSELFDTDDIHSTVTDTDRLSLGAVAFGFWQIYATVRFAANATGRRTVLLVKNGSAETFSRINPAATLATHVFASTVVEITDAADYVSCAVEQNSGGNLNVEGGASNLTQFGATYLGS